ncbi:MAG: hypothetical protein K2L06_03375 [Alistipes sp.]|nr:hypothetical protein [Alistipes sp.]
MLANKDSASRVENQICGKNAVQISAGRPAVKKCLRGVLFSRPGRDVLFGWLVLRLPVKGEVGGEASKKRPASVAGRCCLWEHADLKCEALAGRPLVIEYLFAPQPPYKKIRVGTRQTTGKRSEPVFVAKPLQAGLQIG